MAGVGYISSAAACLSLFNPQLISSQEGHMKRETRTQPLGRNAWEDSRTDRVHLASRGALMPFILPPTHAFILPSILPSRLQ